VKRQTFGESLLDTNQADSLFAFPERSVDVFGSFADFLFGRAERCIITVALKRHGDQ